MSALSFECADGFRRELHFGVLAFLHVVRPDTQVLDDQPVGGVLGLDHQCDFFPLLQGDFIGAERKSLRGDRYRSWTLICREKRESSPAEQDYSH